MSQLVDLGCFSRSNPLGQLNKATNPSPLGHCIGSCAGLDANDTDTWILWPTIVLAVTEIADPSLKCGRVMLLHNGAIGLDGGFAGDGCPLAAVVDEANVDGLVLLQVIGLARLGVGVEEKVKALRFLLSV